MLYLSAQGALPRAPSCLFWVHYLVHRLVNSGCTTSCTALSSLGALPCALPCLLWVRHLVHRRVYSGCATSCTAVSALGAPFSQRIRFPFFVTPFWDAGICSRPQHRNTLYTNHGILSDEFVCLQGCARLLFESIQHLKVTLLLQVWDSSSVRSNVLNEIN